MPTTRRTTRVADASAAPPPSHEDDKGEVASSVVLECSPNFAGTVSASLDTPVDSLVNAIASPGTTSEVRVTRSKSRGRKRGLHPEAQSEEASLSANNSTTTTKRRTRRPSNRGASRGVTETSSVVPGLAQSAVASGAPQTPLPSEKALEVDVTLARDWSYLRQGLEKIVNNVDTISRLSSARLRSNVPEPLTRVEWVAMYSRVHALFTRYEFDSARPGMIYSCLREYLQTVVAQQVQAMTNRRAKDLLRQYIRSWNSASLVSGFCLRVFSYMERYWIPNFTLRDDIMPINALIVEAWHREVASGIVSRIVSTVLTLIDQERRGCDIDKNILLAVCDAFQELRAPEGARHRVDFYKDVFEKAVVERTRLFYRHYSAGLKQCLSVDRFLEEAKKCMHAEVDRASMYLRSKSSNALCRVVVDEMVNRNRDFLVGEGQRLIQASETGPLKVLHELCGLIDDGHAVLAHVLKDYAISEGSEITRDHREKGHLDNLSDSVSFVNDLLTLQDKILHLLSSCLAGSVFSDAYSQSFRSLLSSPFGSYDISIVLSHFLNMAIRRLSAKEQLCPHTRTRLQHRISGAVELLRHVEDKDVFQETYRRDLGARLLLGVSDEMLERNVVSSIARATGHVQTTRYARMLREVAMSRTHLKLFRRAYADKLRNIGVDFTVTTLSAHNWPLRERFTGPVHPSLSQCLQLYENYFHRETSSRKLIWAHSHASVTLQCDLGCRFKVESSASQASVLLRFNEQSVFNINDMGIAKADKSGLIDEVQFLVQDGVSGPLLFFNPDTGDCRLNESFMPKQPHLSLRPTTASATTQDTSEVRSRVEIDRSVQVDAALVRLLKRGKRLVFHDLFSDLCHQVSSHFRPDEDLVGDRVDALINKEYIRRDESNPEVLVYVA